MNRLKECCKCNGTNRQVVDVNRYNGNNIYGPCDCDEGRVFMTKWDDRFIDMAQLVAGWSKDPSTQCGAVVVRPDHTVCSTGYNGFPRGLVDDPKRYEDRTAKYEVVVHAEMNALLFAHEAVSGYSLFCWPMLPCNRCAVHIVQAGIKRVVAPASKLARWLGPIALTKELFESCGVEFIG